MMKTSISFIFIFLLTLTPAFAASTFGPNYVDVAGIQNLKVDLRYSTPNNFTHQRVYQNLNRAYLHKIAYQKLVKAAELLHAAKPKWKFIIFDALRPRSAQRRLFEVVKGTPESQYVMDPDKGSFHNYGFAVDLGLVDEKDQEVDMGTGFDNFTVLAQPRLEAENLKAGKLSAIQIANRKILKDCMETAGFTQLPIEWWHFDAIPRAELVHYPVVE